MDFLLQLKPFLKIINITPKITRIIPIILLKVKTSLKNITPKKIALKGSNAPKIEVIVAPISRMETLIVSIDIIVGKIANANAHAKTRQSLIGCNSVQNLRLTTKTHSAKNIT